jgi:hypothetical protein
MRLTLCLPGSLVPSELSADLLPSLDAPVLLDRLARSELANERAATESVRGAAHLDWIADVLFSRSRRRALRPMPCCRSGCRPTARSGMPIRFTSLWPAIT